MLSPWQRAGADPPKSGDGPHTERPSAERPSARMRCLFLLANIPDIPNTRDLEAVLEGSSSFILSFISP